MVYRRGGYTDAGEVAGGRGAPDGGHRTPDGRSVEGKRSLMGGCAEVASVGGFRAWVYCLIDCVFCNFDPRVT